MQGSYWLVRHFKMQWVANMRHMAVPKYWKMHSFHLAMCTVLAAATVTMSKMPMDEGFGPLLAH
jgi:hypothetical protein